METTEHITGQGWARPALVLTSTLALILIGWLLFNPLFLNVDSSMYLEVGRYLLDGRVPYVDYVELNPPLIHYINVLPVALAGVLNLNPIIIYKVLVLLLIAYSAGVSFYLLRSSKLVQVVPFHYFAPAMILLATLLDYSDYGQRDHLIALVLIPWMILRTKRYESEETGRGLALLVGILAAIGMALRPYFVVPLALVELYYLARHREWRHIFRAESLIVIVVGLLYLAHFFVILPVAAREAFFNELIPLVGENYESYALFSGEDFWLLMNARYLHWIYMFFALVGFFALLPKTYRNGLMVPFLIFAAGSYGVYLYQQLGFTYHLMPFIHVMVLLFMMILLAMRRAIRDDAKLAIPASTVRLLQVAFIASSVILILLLSVATRILNVPPSSDDVVAVIEEQTMPEETVFFVDSAIAPAYPELIKINRRGNMSYPVAFPVAFGVYDSDNPEAFYGEADLPIEIIDYLEVLAADIAQYDPELIFVKQASCYGCPDDFDIHRMLEGNGFIEDNIAAGYVVLDANLLEEFIVYERVARD